MGGGNHHNALGVVRALGRRGYQVELITIGNFDESVKKAAEFSKSFSKDSYIVADLFSQRPIVFDSDNIWKKSWIDVEFSM